MSVLFLLLLVAQSASSSSGPALEAVPFDSPRWDTSGVDLSSVEHLGRAAIELREGLLTLGDEGFVDGILEVDVALPDARGFIGVVWRLAAPGDYEHFYLRPHRSGHPDACQYTPVFHGVSGWQLYFGPGYSRSLELALGRWTHLRVVVWQGTAWIYVDSTEPVLTARLQREVQGGGLGLLVPGFAPAHFADFRWAELTSPPPEARLHPLPELEVPAAAGRTISRWEVSGALDGSRLANEARLPEALTRAAAWTTLGSEPTGLANLARVQGLAPGRDTCLVRARIRTEAARVVPLDFGFSDDVQAYLNGRLLFAGRDGYRTRDERFLGSIGYFDTLFLDLRAGDNELVFAVRESFGGWGLQARLGAEDLELP